MPSNPAVYRFDLVSGVNVWLNFDAEIFWGYSQDEIRAMGAGVIAHLIHHDDLHLVAEHHKRMAGLNLGEHAEVYCRAWGKADQTPRFVHFVDRCVAHDGERCTIIEGTFAEVPATDFDLRKLIERGMLLSQFTLHYQPICRLSDGQVVGYEALARWESGGQCHAPYKFLNVIEGSTLEIPWLLHQVAMVEAAILALPAPLWVSLNVSESALRADVLPSILAASPQPERFAVEILESVSVADGRTLDAIREIKAARHIIKADDVGASGSDGLSRFLVDGLFEEVKLDGNLVRGILADAGLAAITRHVISLAKVRGMTITCEWVECREQAELLQSWGCDFGQGKLFGLAQPWDLIAPQNKTT